MNLPGCRCPECWGLAEYMLQLTGRGHGLPLARGHAPLVEAAPERPAPIARQVPAPPPRQPWEPRLPRRSAG